MTAGIGLQLVLRTLLTSLCVVAAAQPNDEVQLQLQSAVQRLETSEYHWVTETESSLRTRPPARKVEGWVREDGLTSLRTSAFNQPAEALIHGDKAALRSGHDPWTAVALNGNGYRSSGPSTALLRSLRPPHEELSKFIESASQVTGTASSVQLMIPPEATAKLFELRRGRERLETSGAVVEVQMSAGEILSYTIQFEAVPESSQPTQPMKQRSSTRIDAGVIDWATVVSPEGEQKLKEPLSETDQRLTIDEEREVFLHYGKRPIGVHDPSSIVQCGDRYWLFSTGTGILSWWSYDLKDWHSGPAVLPEMPTWVKAVVPDHRGHYWAPDVVKIDDRYLLYYSVSSFGVNTSAIALVSTQSLNPEDEDYGWKDHGIVVSTTQDDNFNAIDPALLETDNGQLWMSFGSFWSGLKLLQLDPSTGTRVHTDSPLHSLAWSPEIEAPHMTFRDGWYYLFVNHGKCCRGVESTYSIRVGRSRDITGPYLDREGRNLLSGGGTLVVDSDGPLIGPGHANVSRNGDRFLLHFHYYDGTEQGRSMLAITELKWDSEGWPILNVRQ